MGVRNYRDLLVWQKAMDLVQEIYKATKTFPQEELFCLTSQLRRAGISIPSNIAEGEGRKSKKEFLHHLSIAYGSLREVETQVLIAERLEYLAKDKLDRLMGMCAEVGLLINGLSRSITGR